MKLRIDFRNGRRRMMDIMRSIDYELQLDRLAKDRHSAAEKGLSRCQRCGLCCWTRPGALTQTDLAALAKHHGLSEKEFFGKYCAVDERAGSLVVILLRADEAMQAGRYLSAEQTWSASAPCVFLREEPGRCSCAVQAVKPTECRVSKCWRPSKELLQIRWTEAELYVLGWDGWTGEFADDYED